MARVGSMLLVGGVVVVGVFLLSRPRRLTTAAATRGAAPLEPSPFPSIFGIDGHETPPIRRRAPAPTPAAPEGPDLGSQILGYTTQAARAGATVSAVAQAPGLVTAVLGIVAGAAGLAFNIKEGNPAGSIQSSVNLARQAAPYVSQQLDQLELAQTSYLEFGAELTAPGASEAAPGALELGELSATALEFGAELPAIAGAELPAVVLSEAAPLASAAVTEGAATSGAVVGAEVGSTVGLSTGLGALGITLALASIVDMVVNLLTPKKLPFAQGYSAVDTKTSQLSKATGVARGQALVAYIDSQQDDPAALLALTLAGAQLAPHGELLIRHDRAGSGGDWQTAADPALIALIQRVRGGDLAALRDFVSGIRVYIGETGATRADWFATDWYRRTFVAALGPQVQSALAPLDRLWELPTPAEYLPVNQFRVYFGDGLAEVRSRLGDVNVIWGMRSPYPWQMYTNGAAVLAPFFRPEGELELTDADRAMLVDRYTANTQYKIQELQGQAAPIAPQEWSAYRFSQAYPDQIYHADDPYQASLVAAMSYDSGGGGGD